MRSRLAAVVTAVLVATLVSSGASQERATAGDPVDLFTGLHTRENDDIVVDGSPGIRLTRAYRNRDPRSRAFGIGTSHSYDLYLVSDSPDGGYADLVLKDGGRVRYVRTNPGSPPSEAVLVHTGTPTEFFMSRLRAAGEGWEIELRDGTLYTFQGCRHRRNQYPPCALIGIRTGSGNRLTMVRDDAGNLTSLATGWFRKVYLTYDSARRIVDARTNLGPSMTRVAYEYDEPGRLVKVTWRHLSWLTVVAELVGAYADVRLPSLHSMWLERTMEYTYDERHQMLAVREPGMSLDHKYDAAERVVRQHVAGWGTWEFTYTEDGGRVVQADVTDPDGIRRRIVFNPSGYSLTDTTAPGRPEERATIYERTTGNVVTRVTVKCRGAEHSAAIAAGESEKAVTSRLQSQCGG